MPLTISGANAVLIVDANDQSELKASLDQAFRVHSAASFAEAVEQLARFDCSFILIDPDLPDGDGMELLRLLRSEPAFRSAIIVCMTKRKSVKEKVAGFQMGADDYLVKPIDPQKVSLRLRLLHRMQGE